MAKESMKAREVKRAKLVAKYAEKKAALKAAGDYEAYQALQRVPERLIYTPAQPLLDHRSSQRLYAVSSASRASNSAKWLQPASSPASKRQAGNLSLYYRLSVLHNHLRE